jgi:hypothetical protein
VALALSAFHEGHAELCEPKWILESPYAAERNRPLRGKNAGKLRYVKNHAVIKHLVASFARYRSTAIFTWLSLQIG